MKSEKPKKPFIDIVLWGIILLGFALYLIFRFLELKDRISQMTSKDIFVSLIFGIIIVVIALILGIFFKNKNGKFSLSHFRLLFTAAAFIVMIGFWIYVLVNELML